MRAQIIVHEEIEKHMHILYEYEAVQLIMDILAIKEKVRARLWKYLPSVSQIEMFTQCCFDWKWSNALTNIFNLEVCKCLAVKPWNAKFLYSLELPHLQDHPWLNEETVLVAQPSFLTSPLQLFQVPCMLDLTPKYEYANYVFSTIGCYNWYFALHFFKQRIVINIL